MLQLLHQKACVVHLCRKQTSPSFRAGGEEKLSCGEPSRESSPSTTWETRMYSWPCCRLPEEQVIFFVCKMGVLQTKKFVSVLKREKIFMVEKHLPVK